MKPRVFPPVLLVIIVVAYVAVATLYAVLTPIWQVPDEPAHYNYVRALAEGRGFPIIESGDYDQAYLRQLTSEGFPPELPVVSLEYEDHQPPLYYLLATPVYMLFDGAVLPLRLLSVMFGAGLLVVAFATVRSIFPARPELALATVAFIAFIPQHVAMTAGVNNDALAELVVGGVLWALTIYVDGRMDRPWMVGLLLAAALLTKTTAYVVVAVALVAVALRWRLERERRSWRWAAGQLAWVLVPALLIATPWFVRNGMVYGWHDPLGLVRHNAIVDGQPRTSEWLTNYGWSGLLIRMARTTFHSFWGQFGWMAVPLPRYLYRALGMFSILLVVGFIIWAVTRLYSPGQSIRLPRMAYQLSLLAMSAFLTFASFLWYNLTFVQHQGRYLFPALIPLGTAAALGLSALMRPLPRPARLGTLIALFAGMAALDVHCLFEFVIPFLTR